MKVFLHDVAKCNGCYCCQFACKDEHVGNDWSPTAKPQPETGQFWLKLNEHVRGTIPKVKMHYVPLLCQHCDDAPCLKACKVPGALYKRADGLVIIDSVKCTGCMSCVTDCPYGVIFYNDDLRLAQKCTGCAHLLDQGWKEPRCVDACPTGALLFMEESEAKEAIDKAELLDPQYNTKPRVYYLNVPKKFVAGTVYDPDAEEIIKGAVCTLHGDGKQYTTTTDGFGDFWFEGLEQGHFVLEIEAAGFESKTIDSISTESDINLGDLALLKGR